MGGEGTMLFDKLLKSWRRNCQEEERHERQDVCEGQSCESCVRHILSPEDKTKTQDSKEADMSSVKAKLAQAVSLWVVPKIV